MALESLELPESELAMEAAIFSLLSSCSVSLVLERSPWSYVVILFVVLCCCWWSTIFRLDGPKISCARDASIIYIDQEQTTSHLATMISVISCELKYLFSIYTERLKS